MFFIQIEVEESF